MTEGMMDALYYHAPRNFEIRRVPIPEVGDDEVLLKVSYCGVCGTDSHVHEGEFITKFPLIPGHEVVGSVVKFGKEVRGFEKGNRVVGDPSILCEDCFYCRRGKVLLCENYEGRGVTLPGGFAEYCIFQAKKLFKIHNLTDLEATLIEPAACAIHGLDKLSPPVGIEALIIGSGPTGLILAQLLKRNGAMNVVIAANKGIKMEVARRMNAGHKYVELDRGEGGRADEQWEELRMEHPYGFDVVVEATGSEKIANMAINYVRKGGTLMVYGVYDNAALVHWPPSKIFNEEINIIGSFAQTHCFPRAVQYLENGIIEVKELITDIVPLAEYQTALDKMKSRNTVKIAIKP
ncbi:NADP+-dependent D-mannitol dehydrogenase [Cristinia sonorae]|uniref:NADP+-dependent D-mannitol dehydrogenase n=1 Tax=Cristinia sonorae TaxID=1940300 RepID=A0A8K0XQV2_9AGAR|nr:NADP+-dependent D-mannitol dehydrogenase [Cristinia sonorae]